MGEKQLTLHIKAAKKTSEFYEQRVTNLVNKKE